MDSFFTLPDDATLYRALASRDPAYEGRAWVGVRTTGIFCRLSCPARKPRPENCRWFDSPAAALGAGFRPCLRCHPSAPEAEGDPVIRQMLSAVTADPARRWTEADVAAAGLDPSTVRRAFQRHYGMSFLDFTRQSRLRQGLRGLSGGAPVIEAQLDAGFDSASGFREAFARLFGHPPAAMARGAPGLAAEWLDTPLGGMIAVADDRSLHLLEFPDRKGLAAELRRLSARAAGRIGLGRSAVTDRAEAQLAAYFAGEGGNFDLPLTLHGTPFLREVWTELQRIPPGATVSYGGLAARLGRPTGARAIARAVGANQIAIVVPCHRVIGADGSLTGYAGGLWRKQALIGIERKLAQQESGGR
ncbi:MULTISPECIES: bifunctional transcriptional activator/DNA repair enzyme AdaA [unclassified Paracoccus (in: a-proteobacteria)]|uniref:bifunctional transcriptional activator/DNA repair enzyme AdaA n=1 Tax=unclassified Paracoccus (in: a-proteobacteria) TaxID=2688777 RepID=UPI00160152B6|nr:MULTISPECIES: trifunctional transcriptional activator/DNA repair protein Ada/methylated-DNA--[protein]-cysteine S-methyltransferase [unclassified Paracoccus (in: a-proteobacteria)]MBB1492873.1 bifunctional transcriptional activator/DNA repair protein Ada [Paracoccus sp. MC1854]MBB1499408.1 bifunctional transcriptional activator/DNA repair protein Ada [Paracoccus sp. MC1862]QQO45366.1 bifunctional transcriptional activator/DNA repair protein Ada [Paracoccus sp. MC1862]